MINDLKKVKYKFFLNKDFLKIFFYLYDSYMI